MANTPDDHSGKADQTAEDADMARRLDELQSQIDRASPQEMPDDADKSGGHPNRGVGRALHIGTEFIAGVLVGGFIGYVFDRALGTKPFGFIVFFLLGMAAGLLNVVRSARRLQEDMPDVANRAAPAAKDDDDD